jgi:hypothetical protein
LATQRMQSIRPMKFLVFGYLVLALNAPNARLGPAANGRDGGVEDGSTHAGLRRCWRL